MFIFLIIIYVINYCKLGYNLLLFFKNMHYTMFMHIRNIKINC